MNKLLRIHLTQEQYENIRQQLCHCERILHADIARELGINVHCNLVTAPDANDPHVCNSLDADGLLEVWTDGSAEMSQKSVTYAVYWGEGHPMNYSRKMSLSSNTNNEAELSAILHVLDVIPWSQPVIIYSDSEVAIKIMTQLDNYARMPHYESALTKRDSPPLACIKRGLIECLSVRSQHDTRTVVSHVYSHLLDQPQKLDDAEHKRRMDIMRNGYGDQYLRVLQGNEAADKLASTAHAHARPNMPITSVLDPLYPAYVITNQDEDAAPVGKIDNKRRLGEDLRKEIYDARRATTVDEHKKRQRKAKEDNPDSIALDYTCLEFDSKTDMRQSARVMQSWRSTPMQANTFNFLYRARRGALLEKSKAFHRIREEEAKGRKPMFERFYGKKYKWNTRCPCCLNSIEENGHVLTDCSDTQNKFRRTLREEVINTLKTALKDDSHEELTKLPAWFACGDDTVRVPPTGDAHLKEIANYDKHLGTLAYIPSALVIWLRTLHWQNGSASMHSALLSVQHLLAKTAHAAWVDRCKRFEEQWRAECKRRTEAEQQRQQSVESRAPAQNTPPVTQPVERQAATPPTRRETNTKTARVEDPHASYASTPPRRQRDDHHMDWNSNAIRSDRNGMTDTDNNGRDARRKRTYLDLDTPR
jgi:ribonuclease HI